MDYTNTKQAGILSNIAKTVGEYASEYGNAGKSQAKRLGRYLIEDRPNKALSIGSGVTAGGIDYYIQSRNDALKHQEYIPDPSDPHGMTPEMVPEMMASPSNPNVKIPVMIDDPENPGNKIIKKIPHLIPDPNNPGKTIQKMIPKMVPNPEYDQYYTDRNMLEKLPPALGVGVGTTLLTEPRYWRDVIGKFKKLPKGSQMGDTIAESFGKSLLRKALWVGGGLAAQQGPAYLHRADAITADAQRSAEAQRQIMEAFSKPLGDYRKDLQEGIRSAVDALKASKSLADAGTSVADSGKKTTDVLAKIPDLWKSTLDSVDKYKLPIGIGLSGMLGISGLRAYNDYKYRRAAEEGLKRKVKVTLPSSDGGHQTQVETAMDELPESLQQALHRDLKRKLRNESEERKMHKQSADETDTKPNDEKTSDGETTEVVSHSTNSKQVADEFASQLGKTMTKLYGNNKSTTVKQAFKEGFVVAMAERGLLPSDLEKYSDFNPLDVVKSVTNLAPSFGRGAAGAYAGSAAASAANVNPVAGAGAGVFLSDKDNREALGQA